MKAMIRFCLIAALIKFSSSLPNGFVDEGIADIKAVTGAFAPNPRNNGEPMFFLSAKEGTIVVLEDPDNSDDSTEIADMESRMCTNGERGLQTIRPHPDFEVNRFLYMYYSVKTSGCKESASDGPVNRLSRFKMDESSLKVDMSSEFILLETSPAAKRMHNGGTIQFGNDGKLWVTIGDGGSRKPPVSQDRGMLYGSVLRLNDDGTVPSDNPYAEDGVRCGKRGGTAPSGKRCSEIYAYGLRNPFRLVMDPNTKNKVKFHVGDVGASAWEEISVGGSDYAGANYGWPPMEGPCRKGGGHTDCPVNDDFLDPFYYYEHTGSSAGGAVTGSAFVPEGLWPKKYKYMFIDFVYHEIYNLIEDPDRERRRANPPVPGYRNETFHEFPFMVDMFFGPYKNTQALYYVARSNGQNVRRIRYTGNGNRAPDADIDVADTTVAVGESVAFDGRDSSDADGDELDFFWEFGDGSTSTKQHPEHAFDRKGEYKVTLTITDERDQTDQAFVNMVVGSPPLAMMISPKEGDEFFVGQELELLGFGEDSEGNELDSSRLFWEVRQHHAEHFHPFRDRKAGNDILLFPAPEPEDFNAATNSFLEVILYAVDSDGLESKVSRRIMPKLVFVDVDSDPQGLKVLIDEFSVTTPGTITTWENHELRLDVERQWPFAFDFWFDDGAHQHSITVPAASSTNLFILATFKEDATSPEPIPLISDVRDCSARNKCQQCEGHCMNDSECAGTLLCFQKGGKGRSVPGCIGTDNSNTDWCTIAEILVNPPTLSPPASPLPTTSSPNLSPPTPSPLTSPPPSPTTLFPSTLSPPTPASSTPPAGSFVLGFQYNFCNICGADNLRITDETAIINFPAFAPQTCRHFESAGFFGIIEAAFCPVFPAFSGSCKCEEIPTGVVAKRAPAQAPLSVVESAVATAPVPDDIPLLSDVRICSFDNKCQRCEGHCRNDNDCEGPLLCFEKRARGTPVPGCTGIDNSLTSWCVKVMFALDFPNLNFDFEGGV